MLSSARETETPCPGDHSESAWAAKHSDPDIPVAALRIASSTTSACMRGRKLVVLSKEHDRWGQRCYRVLWVGDEDVARVTAKFLETDTQPL